LRPGPAQPVTDAAPWLATTIVQDRGKYSWEHVAQGIHLTHRGGEFSVQMTDLATCSQRHVETFTVVTCGSDAELLYEGRAGIMASFSDYSDRSAFPLARFRLGGKQAVLVRIGLKAQVVIGLIVKDGHHWRLSIREADYPLLC
jgi:hypothetical protein